MSFSTLDFTVHDRIATVTLNRPEAGNAMNQAMHKELRQAWHQINDDDDIWAAMVTGAGDVFSTGDDLDELAALAEQEQRPDRWDELLGWQKRYQNHTGVSGIPEPSKGLPGKPLIAVINGLCAGPAMMLAVHSDFVLAADDAEFSLPQLGYGLAPIDEAITLTRLVMRPTVTRLAMMGGQETLSAERARQIGLVLETVPRDELLDRARTMLSTMNDWSAPLAVRGAKAAIWGTINLSWDDAHRWGHMYLHEVRFHTEDAKEGPRAFAQKRKPNWQAR